MITLVWVLTIISLIDFWVCALVYEEKLKVYETNEQYNKVKYLIAAIFFGLVFAICFVYLIKHYIGFCGL